MSEEIMLWATFRFAGFHSWPGASEERRYLAARHRHLFHAKVWVEAEHDDRDIEFHDLGDALERACKPFAEAGALSCEQMAKRIREEVSTRWPGRLVQAEVSEDGEFGAVTIG